MLQTCLARTRTSATGSTKTINNGIDLAGNGGAVWIKTRSEIDSNIIVDTARGKDYILQTNTSGAQADYGAYVMQEFLSDGFRLGSQYNVNKSGANFASWTFRKAPRFFDVVTYSGNGSNRVLSHNLGAAPGMILVKCANANTEWMVYHVGQTNANYITKLNLTDAQASIGSVFNGTVPTDSEFSLGTYSETNGSGFSFVAYLFANDEFPNGFIRCGSFVTDGSGGATVDLGWSPQFVIYKRINSTSNWTMLDTARGWVDSAGNDDMRLFANTTAAEAGTQRGNPTSGGFSVVSESASSSYIYMAIRAA